MEKMDKTVKALKEAIQDGIESGIARRFDPKEHLKALKTGKRSNRKSYTIPNKSR